MDINDAFVDRPSAIGYGQTISAPHMHAMAGSYLLDKVGSSKDTPVKILDVGSGSGYLCAVFALALPRARVVGIDVIPELVQMSIVCIYLKIS
jgi:protein-L-isoaspartate(D-aspartate) O-methyltransferase